MEGAPQDAHDAWEREEAARAAFSWFGPPAPATETEQPAKAPAEPVAAANEARRLTGNIAIDTGGELVPRYEFVGQRAEQLVSGDLMYEPRFGPVRITWVAAISEAPTKDQALLQLRWRDIAGYQWAARAVPPETPVVLRVPDRRDGAVIQRAIDRAHYFGTSLGHRGARLIAAHLQHCVTSGLYRLAVSGEIQPATFEELTVMAESRRPYVSRWSRALYTYCQRRPDHGPLGEHRSQTS